MQTGDIRLIKNINDRLVLNLIREHEIVSGAELAQITGMQPSTISNILKELLSKSLIINRGKGNSTDKGGKRPILWSLNGQCLYVAGIDLAIGKIGASLLSMTGEIIAHRSTKVAQADTREELIEQVRTAADDIISHSGVESERILGLGVAIAGIVDRDHGVVRSSGVLPQQNIPLLQDVQTLYSFPVMIENDANAAAIGAKWAGSARGCKNYITVLIKVDRHAGGLGIGLVLNNEIYHGANFCSGELNSHLPSLTQILGMLRSRFNESDWLKDCSDSVQEISMAQMIHAAQQNDPVGILCFNLLGHLIGKTISGAIALINPEKVIIAGDLAALEDLIIEPVRREIALDVLNGTAECLQIQPSIHGRASVAIGAASLILDEFFKIPVVHGNRFVNS